MNERYKFPPNSGLLQIVCRMVLSGGFCNAMGEGKVLRTKGKTKRGSMNVLFRRRLRAMNDYCSKFVVELNPSTLQPSNESYACSCCLPLLMLHNESCSPNFNVQTFIRKLFVCCKILRLKMVAGKVQMEFNLISE